MKLKNLILGLTAAVSLASFGGTKIIKNGDTLVFMGDSITKFGNDHAYGYLHLVASGLAANGINVTWYGAGISGETAVQMKSRFQSNVVDRKPQVCTIFGGVNDCTSKESGGWPNDKSSSPDDIAAMADMAIANGIVPVLLSPTSNGGEGYRQDIRDYAAAVKTIAQERNVPYAATYETFRAYVDDAANPAIDGNGYKLTADGVHMSLLGDRMLAREVLKAFGLDATEIAKAEAEWNKMTGLSSFHPSVKITAGEYKSVKVAAEKAGKSLGEYQRDLFARGTALMAQNPVKVSATSGADVQFSTTVSVGYPQYDQMLDAGRTMSTHDSVPAIANYALLAAVHELPAVTDAELPSEPVVSVDTSAFSKQVEFTCSGYTGSSTLADFPVAVRLSAGSPDCFAYSDMYDSTKGNEIRFADDEGNSLSYEVENWDPNGTSLIWVKIPSLSKGTTFTMYYGGDPTDVVASDWTWRASDYVGVWHMTEDGGTAFDSANGLDAEPIGAYAKSMQKSTTGVFGKGRVNSSTVAAYQGQSMLQVSDSTLLDCGNTFTFSGWVQMTDISANNLGRIVSRNRGGSYAPEWELRFPNFTTLNGYANSNTPVSGTLASVEDKWVHIAGVFNGTTLTTYANGVQVFSSAINAVPDSDNKLVFGAFDIATPNGHFVGDYDEYRLRDAVSSADWVKAEYDQSKTTFLSAGEATDVTGGQPAHTHDWGEPAHTWTQTQSGYDCTATVTCKTVASHKKSLTVTATYAVVTAATADVDGLGRYTATFTSAPFTSSVTKDVTIPKTGGTTDPTHEDPVVDPSGAISPSGATSGATDTSAIQAAIDAAASSHGTVVLGSGDFYLNDSLDVHDGVTLKGQGWGRTVLKAAGEGYRGATLDGGAKLEGVTVTGFKINTKWYHGAGVLVTDGSVSWCCISNNVLSSNNSYGGGIAFPDTGKGSVDHSIIAFNQAGAYTSGGGGIAIYSSPNAITIDACLVYGNTTSVSDTKGNGGGIGVFMNQPTVTIRNTTIVGNTSTDKAGGFSSDSYNKNKVTLVNCIVSGNTAASDANVYGTAGTGWSNNLIGDDAKFTNAAAYDFTLTSSSPAKGAGATYSGIGKDLAGSDFANPPSMGCYEFGSSVKPDDPGQDDPPATDQIELGDVTMTPSVDYNGNLVSVDFSGEIPDGADMLASMLVNDKEIAGFVSVSDSKVTFNVPSVSVTAGNTYPASIMLYIGNQFCMKEVTLAQGTLKVDADANWIKESASSFKSTGSWTGDKAAVQSGKISVSNATFTASKAAAKDAVVTVESTFDFAEALDAQPALSARAGIWVVNVGNAYRYAMLKSGGAVTNTTVTASVGSAQKVTVTMDNAAKTVKYEVGGTTLGTYAMTAKSEGVKTVRYLGATDVTALDGNYRFEGLDANLAKAGDTEYATVAEALASGKGPVKLLWDASWTPSEPGDYTVMKDGHELVIGGDLAYTLKDNGDGSITVTVGGTPAPKKPHVIFYVD